MALTQIVTTDSVSASVVNTKIVDKANADISGLQIAQTAGGTATAITLTGVELTNGYQKTFVISASNSGAATTINGKPLYKPGGTVAPNLIAGKSASIWYNLAGDCFFYKASAEGTAVAGDVLATKTFSNDDDTGLSGTMANRGAVAITPSAVQQAIVAGYHNGSGYVAGDADLIAPNILAGKNIFGIDGTAKRWATGTTYASTVDSQWGMYQAVVTGLPFNPSFVIGHRYNTNGQQYMVIATLSKSGLMRSGSLVYSVVTVDTGGMQTCYNVSEVNSVFQSGGFTVRGLQYSDARIDWIAFE